MKATQTNVLVTVCIPVYNTEKYLIECLESVLRQKYENLEILLVNDGSLDSSGSIADQYARRDSRVEVIHKQNEGVSKAKNLAIKKATGKFITFIDSDDYIREDFIENLVNDMTNYGVLIATTPTEICPISEDDLANIAVYSQYETLEKMFYGTLERSENGMQMFDRNLLVDNDILFDPTKKIGEDFDFFVRVLTYCKEVVVDYRKMYYYRPNPTSTMHQKVNKNLMNAVANFSSIGEKLLKKYPDLQGAINAKKFSDSVSLAMRGYHVRNEWRDEFEELEYNIRSIRWRVLLDNKARKKVRVAALIYCALGIHAGTVTLRRLKK